MRRVIQFIGRYVLGVVGCLYLLTVGVWRKSHREILHEVLFRLGLRKRPLPESNVLSLLIPNVPVKSLLNGDIPFRLLEPDCEEGNVSGYELAVICGLVAQARPMKCLEIGTFDGRTTLNIAANMPADGVVYTLDLPSSEAARTTLNLASGDVRYIEKAVSGCRFAASEHRKKIVQLYGDSAKFDFSQYEGQMDLVFVDGSHSYEYVKHDTQIALKLLKAKGGMIIWHDYGSKWWKGLTQALNELYGEWPALKAMKHLKGTMMVVLCR
jgi:hypothetical protein